jgi:hypothetical protein
MGSNPILSANTDGGFDKLNHRHILSEFVEGSIIQPLTIFSSTQVSGVMWYLYDPVIELPV